MRKQLLQKGDVIRLEKGMRVYTQVPEKFFYQNRVFSEELTEHDITIGEIYRREEVSKDSVIKEVKDKVEYVVPATYEQVKNFMESLGLDYETQELDTSVYEGEYVVNYVNYDGGGIQGTPSGYETYPNGWHVFCTKKDNPSIQVNFYQTGCFTAMIPNITPINQQ